MNDHHRLTGPSSFVNWQASNKVEPEYRLQVASFGGGQAAAKPEDVSANEMLELLDTFRQARRYYFEKSLDIIKCLAPVPHPYTQDDFFANMVRLAIRLRVLCSFQDANGELHSGN